MPLEHYKTQVLLLHSEQSMLDNLSSGFNDRYTVHCATSGSEALNTLGETPIHVIVSAQDLPGMSGVEALREAKKRSPETIGILLAGANDQGLEALVGDKEVFQVIRGGVNADDLGKLIDDATRQMRLMALAESANDTTANVDMSSGEHIVMETSENGAAIISDGTGRMPALDPKKVSASTTVGAQTVDVLVLTQDEEFLATIKESSRGLHNVHYANTLKQAESAVKDQKVGVAVVDAAMVGDNVEKLTQHLRRFEKRLVSIVAGRRDDGEMLMDLINRGKVYRFLLKPVSPGRARLAVEASVKHHLEAPDSAFKAVGQPASPPAQPPKPEKKPKAKAKAKPAAPLKPQPKAQPAPPPKPKPKPKPAAAAAAAPAAEKKAQAAPAEKRVEPTIIDDPLTAFDGDDSSFTETMTGIVETVGKSITDIKESFSSEKSPGGLDSLDSGTGGGFEFNAKIIGAGAVALIALVAVGFWMFGGSEDAPVDANPQATVTESEPVISEPVTEPDPVTRPAPQPVVDTGPSIDELLNEAQLARRAGQVFNPPGSNAIELYAAVLAAEPGNATAQAELDETIDEAFGMAESALLERRVDEADAALNRIALVVPDHARLPFLTAQVSDLKLRRNLDDARSAIRDARFEDAASALSRARALNVPDSSQIDDVAAELSTARSAQQIDGVLARASQRLDEGSLIAPPNDNARYYYELVLSSDPSNAAARQGLTAVASKLVLQARAEIDLGNFNTADAILADARRVDPNSAEVAATERALADARERVVAEQQRLEDARQAEAERAAAERRAAEAEAQRLAAERRAAAAAEAAAAQAAVQQQASSEPQASRSSGSSLNSSEPPAPAIEEAAPVAISSLTRTRYVAPKYPRAAERRSLSGWVDVVFTVNPDGSVSNIGVIGSEPGDVFIESAKRAVEKWEFAPVIENGRAVSKRTAVRMMFAIE